MVIHGLTCDYKLLLMYANFITGAIKDSMMQEFEIAQFLLAILNSRETYKKWENMNQAGDMPSFSHAMSSSSHHNKRQYASDHTQVSTSRYSIEHNSVLFPSSCRFLLLLKGNDHISDLDPFEVTF